MAVVAALTAARQCALLYGRHICRCSLCRGGLQGGLLGALPRLLCQPPGVAGRILLPVQDALGCGRDAGLQTQWWAFSAEITMFAVDLVRRNPLTDFQSKGPAKFLAG